MFESTTGAKKWNVTFYEYSAREMSDDMPYGMVGLHCPSLFLVCLGFDYMTCLISSEDLNLIHCYETCSLLL